jgi:type I restriction enzyme S subunit
MSTYKQSVFGEIPNTWELIEAGKYCEKVTDGTHDSPKQSTEGYPLITSRHIKGSKIDFDNAYLISKEDYDHINKRSYVSQWDVIISMIGEYCGFTYLEENSEINYAIKNVGLFKTGDELKSKWLYYFFQSKYTNHLLNTYRSGTSQPYLALGVLREFPILIPQNHDEQESIVSILDSLRKKIELLQAQNKTLESMAQTIFKEWFGKYQIGDELPEGWRVGEFGEVIEFINGFAFKSKDLSKEPIDNAYKVFKMGDINKGGGFKPGKTKGYYPKSMSTKLNKYILKNGDLLMSMTDMKDAISLLGHTALMIYEDEYIVNQRVGLIRVKNDINIEYPYLYLLTNNDDFIAGIRAGANSGVQVNLSTQGIKETEFIIADKETNKAFNNVVMPLFEKRKANSQMIKELKKTRDTLLPKLMSGQVRVNNIKQTADA